MKNPIWGFIFKKDDSQSVIDLLKTLSPFEKLSRGELKHIERLLHKREYQGGETIFKENDPGAALYIIEEGEVEIYKERSENRVILATLNEKQFFGEVALLDESKRTASAKAVVDTKILAFSHVDFTWIIENSPVISSKILFSLGKLVAKRLNQSNESIEKLQGTLDRDGL